MHRLLGLIPLLLLVACEADEIGPQTTSIPFNGILEGRQVYLINEGNFQWGNASVSAYTPATKKIEHFVFQGFNDGLLLGDIFQNMSVHGAYYYLVINNSGLVRKVDTLTWKQEGTFNGLATPRYIAFWQNKAFVTELYTRQLWVLNLEKNETSHAIPLSANTSKILLWQEYLAIAMENKLVLMSPKTEEIDTIVHFEQELTSFAIDSNNKLWVLASSGNTASLTAIDQNLNLVFEDEFSENHNPSFLQVNPQSQDLWFVANNQIQKLPVLASSLAQLETVVQLQNQNVYGFNVDPKTGDLYLADVLDFAQDSDIYRYSAQGQLLDQFKGGAICNGFWFE